MNKRLERVDNQHPGASLLNRHPLHFFSAAASDGVTEDIRTELSKIGDLKVIALTSAFRFKHSGKSIGEIAGELGVTTILKGSVRRADGWVQITAQLIDAETDEQLWAESYERELVGIFEIQSDVAEQIASALKAELTPEERGQIAAKPTDNLAAYNLYLRGRFLRYEWDTDKMLEAVRCFEEATQLDPDYALAYAGLAECYWLLRAEWRGFADSEEERSRLLVEAEEAAQRALALDRTLPEPHFVWGMIQAYDHLDWAGAEQSFKQATELNPRHWNVTWEYGLFLTRLRRFDEALVQLERAGSLEPTSVEVLGYNLPVVYFRTGNPDQAVAVAQKLIALYPDRPVGYRHRAKLAIYQSDYDQAMSHLNQFKEQFGETRQYFSTYGYLQAMMGHTAEANRCIAKLKEQDVVVGSDIARVYLGLGNRDEVFRWLGNYRWIHDLTVEPEWDVIRDDPRYEQALRKLNLPEDAIARHLEAARGMP